MILSFDSIFRAETAASWMVSCFARTGGIKSETSNKSDFMMAGRTDRVRRSKPELRSEENDPIRDLGVLVDWIVVRLQFPGEPDIKLL